ncbi:TVP38/TMEM64 family protein [Pontivivens insulae]|uniref:TVP38/TMEM64 family membrane protein n=1 Tax=Pontivivens insulae TaxID=1639689 RepID=A0A2R8A6U9_9RHOB|nr:TVP38/TMEM64 family protein [Pontivivens insulae]RED18002.1 putative membrane protein YdjX (TVP38/TMEM64 family) [Pontivivens insulae]SPF27892.1 TVP38/TMEM64 family inner membrane protein YdjZ [Pontivivens insulae]
MHPPAVINSKLRRVAIGATVLLGLILAGILIAFVAGDLDIAAVESRIEAAGLWGGLIVVALMVLHTFIPFPAEVVAFAAGAVFGLVWGTLFVWCGAMLGAWVGFGLARWLGRDAVASLLPDRQLARLQSWEGKNGASALLAARFIPVIAFNLINVAAGLATVRWWTFTWTTAIGILPLTTVMVWFGSTMMVLSWPLIIAISIGGIAMIGLVHWAVARRSA